MASTECETCGSDLVDDEHACAECGAPRSFGTALPETSGKVGCPECVGGIADVPCRDCLGRGCGECGGEGFTVRRCKPCGGTGKLTQGQYDALDRARKESSSGQAQDRMREHQDMLQAMLDKAASAASAGQAQRNAEAAQRASQARAARGKADGVLSVLCFPVAILANFLYVSLNHARVFAGNEREFDPISRWLGYALMSCIPSGTSTGCLGNLLLLLLMGLLYVLHFAICLLLWVPIAFALVAVIHMRK